MDAPDGNDQPYSATGTAAVSSGPRPRVLALVLALLGAGVIALVALRAGDAVSGGGTGADSATGAVEALFGAISNEDVIETAAALPPSEVGHVADLYAPGVELAKETDAMVNDDPFGGVDVAIDARVAEIEELHPSIHRVYLTGDSTVQVSVDPAVADPVLWEGADAVDETYALSEILGEQYLDAEESFGIDRAFLVAIEEGDRWYVSPMYTVMEYLRDAYEVDVPDFDASRTVSSSGFDSADGFVDSIVGAVNDVDDAELIDEWLAATDEALTGDSATLDPSLDVVVPDWVAPDEIDVFVDYAPLFAEIAADLQAQLEQGFVIGPDGSFGEEVCTIDDDGVIVCEVEGGVTGDGTILPPEPYPDDPFEDETQTPEEMAEEIRQAVEDLEIEFDAEIAIDTQVDELGDGRSKVAFIGGRLTGEASWQEPDQPRTKATLDGELYDGICARWQIDFVDLPGDDGPESFTESGDECLELPGPKPAGAFVVMRQIDGSWYFSPIETAVEYGRFAIEQGRADAAAKGD